MQARRGKGAEQGFTLIEVMVVVVIIGILVSIAVPTFLNARTEAQNRSVESDLRNAMTDAQTLYIKNSYAFSTGTALQTDLSKTEPSLDFVSWNGSASAVSSQNVQYVYAASSDDICFAGVSASGKTLQMALVLDPNAGSAKGTYFYIGTGAIACPTASSTSGWARSASGAGW